MVQKLKRRKKGPQAKEGTEKNQPTNEPTKKVEIKDIETNTGKLLDIFIFYMFKSKLHNLAEEIEMDSPDQEDKDPGIRKLEGEKFSL